jgi:hypothetical protein
VIPLENQAAQFAVPEYLRLEIIDNLVELDKLVDQFQALCDRPFSFPPRARISQLALLYKKSRSG